MLNINQLKVLPIEEAIDIINQDLKLLALNGKMTSSFGKEDVEGLQVNCSWSTVTNHYGPLGYKLNRKTYQYELQEGNNEPIRTESVFSEEEVELLRKLIEHADKLLSEKEEIKEEKSIEVNQELRIKPKKGKKKITSLTIYEDTLYKWNQFKDQYAYNPTDLLNVALIEFMEKYKLEELKELETKNANLKVGTPVVGESKSIGGKSVVEPSKTDSGGIGGKEVKPFNPFIEIDEDDDTVIGEDKEKNIYIKRESSIINPYDVRFQHPNTNENRLVTENNITDEKNQEKDTEDREHQ